MEEKGKEQNGKLSYEELNRAASELHVQYQKLMSEYQRVVGELNRLQFDAVGFELTMLFKVLEHKSTFSNNEKLRGTDFIGWVVTRIHDCIVSYDRILQEQVETPEEEKEEKQDEAK
ncbi:MAG: hypothetical protein II661_10660 [Bacteroidales bacterium]|nr:hypothetical protein [Bacteroidales bacterium]